MTVVAEPRGLLSRSTNESRSRRRSTEDAAHQKLVAAPSRRRKRGSGGIVPVRDGVWRVDLEVPRDPVTGHRRRVARIIHGTREDAEVALARLRVADHEKRLPTGGTRARSVAAVLQLYQQAVASGLIELAPNTANTVRWVSKMLTNLELTDGRRFGDIRLSRLPGRTSRPLTQPSAPTAAASPTFAARPRFCPEPWIWPASVG